MAEHQPHWPDKAMFASIMLILAGAMGSLFAAVNPIVSFGSCPAAATSAGPTTSASVECAGKNIPDFLKTYPWWAQLVLSLATLAFGFLSLRAKRKRWSLAGIGTGVASLGFVGFVPILSLLALAFLWQAQREGEDLTGARPISSKDWPDKALAASLFLLVAGVLTFLWGALIAFGASNPVLLSGMAWLEGAFDIGAGLACMVAAWNVYHLRRAWSGYVAIVLAALGLGLYVIGPVLAATALVLLLLARRENEFTTA